jgi:hypothetical protein
VDRDTALGQVGGQQTFRQRLRDHQHERERGIELPIVEQLAEQAEVRHREFGALLDHLLGD